MDGQTDSRTDGWVVRQIGEQTAGGWDRQTYLFNESLVGDQKVKQYLDFSFVAIELRGP